MMTAAELAAKVKDVATNYKTAYLLGCFGWPSSEPNISRAIRECSTNGNRPVWLRKARAINGRGYLFDCVNLIKAILWGWNGDLNKSYGGAVYRSNGVPDIGADEMFRRCLSPSKDFSRIKVGEAVWLSGHIGIYIGDGLAVECTPSFKSGVQITAVANIGPKAGYSSRKWTKHGELPYVSYSGFEQETVLPTISVGDIVQFVGNKHYASSNAVSGATVAAGPARVTAVSQGAAHPYHVIHTDGASRVYGWVDAASLSKTVPAPAKKYRCIPQSGLNIRSGAGTQFSKVGAIRCGTVVDVAEVRDGWGYIHAQGGWACMEYLQEV